MTSIFNIYITNKDLSKKVQLPILPENLPEVSYLFKNDEFETYDNGFYNFIGNKELSTFTLESSFPEYAGKYQYERSSDLFTSLLDILNDVYDGKKQIVRVIFTNDSGALLDDYFSVEGFKYHVDKTGDYQYNIDFKQYREVTQ